MIVVCDEANWFVGVCSLRFGVATEALGLCCDDLPYRALSLTYHDHFTVKIHVLNPQALAFHQPHAGAVQQAGQQGHVGRKPQSTDATSATVKTEGMRLGVRGR